MLCGLCAGNLKLTFPTAVAATQLAWGMLAAPEGYSSSPSTSAHLASLQWATDYLMACRPSANQFVAQVRTFMVPFLSCLQHCMLLKS